MVSNGKISFVKFSDDDIKKMSGAEKDDEIELYLKEASRFNEKSITGERHTSFAKIVRLEMISVRQESRIKELEDRLRGKDSNIAKLRKEILEMERKISDLFDELYISELTIINAENDENFVRASW